MTTRGCCETRWDDTYASGCMVCGGPGEPERRAWEAGAGVAQVELADAPPGVPVLLEELLGGR